MRSIRNLIAISLSVLAGALLAAPPAAAAAAEGGTFGIMITPLPGGVPSTPRFALLTCEPTGGTHPRAAQACDEIAKADGDIAAIPPISGMGCLPVVQPVTLTARGTWQGRAVDFTAEHSSMSCGQISHGAVFWF